MVNGRAVQTLLCTQNVCLEIQLNVAGVQQVRGVGSCISDKLPGDAAVVHRQHFGE